MLLRASEVTARPTDSSLARPTPRRSLFGRLGWVGFAWELSERVKGFADDICHEWGDSACDDGAYDAIAGSRRRNRWRGGDKRE